jgi:hypothetical protein
VADAARGQAARTAEGGLHATQGYEKNR